LFAYHFTGDALKDGSPIPDTGQWLELPAGVLVEPCESGFHASVHPFDALCYAPGPRLHYVELDGEIKAHGDPVDKYAARKRRIIASIDATDLLFRFACDQALSVIHLWNAPQAVRQYLETADETLRDAARAAAEDAAWAAWAARAAWDAAWAAAREAAWDAAREAAWDAAWAAAGEAAWDAAWAAAWAAAGAAAWAAAREDFARRVYAVLPDNKGIF